jgi:TM2 domain-containing membrane protein YozV
MSRYRDLGELSEFEEITVVRPPSPGVAAVLSVLIPGLGQVYSGRLGAGALWFLATAFCYSAVLLPGFLAHALCVWSAYQSARQWRRY